MERYSRNLNVDGFTIEMQEKLAKSSVLVVGAGGLGSAVLNYLVAAGVGSIGIVEYDIVSESNLQRQIMYNERDLGLSKGEVSIKNISRKNSRCNVVLYNTKFNYVNGIEIASTYDIIVDCTDNYATRYIMDTISQELGIAFVYGSAEQLGGQISTFNHNGAGSYKELYPEPPKVKGGIIGVLSPMPGIIGSMQALEVIKILTGFSDNLCGKLLLFDGKTYSSTIFNL